MADISVGSVDTNDRQYNIPLHQELLRWEWVCLVYPKRLHKGKPHPPFRWTGATKREAMELGWEHLSHNMQDYLGWELRQEKVPIAV